MFDSRKELQDKIRLGESTFLELQEVRFGNGEVIEPRDSDLADELAALANSYGGVCALGVSAHPPRIVGIPPHRLNQLVEHVRHVCDELVEPGLDPIVASLSLPGTTGEDVVIVKIDVRRSLFVHRSPAGYLNRVADSKRAMSMEYLARLDRQRSHIGMVGFEQHMVPDATLEALSADLRERFRIPGMGEARTDLLAQLRMVRNDEDGVPRPTVAGILMAAPDPRRWLPNAFIQAVAYSGVRPQVLRGKTRPYQLDAADISGPLDRQVEEACRFVAKNMKVAAFKSLGRVDRPQFDMTAVFEAVVNAVAHRDYSIHGSKIRLRVFADRLELYSPGAIPNMLEPENLLHLQSSRNEVLSSLLAKCSVPSEIPWLATDRTTLMDERGEGMRIIVENSLELSGRAPQYGMIGGSEFLVKIYAPSEESGEPT